MTAAPARLLHPDTGYTPVDSAPAATEKSCPKVFPQAAHAAILSRGLPFDPHRYRTVFPERWAAYLRAHFRTVEEVAVFFDVTFRTANYWWEGTNKPSGDKVALAAITNPDGFKKYLGQG